MQIYLFSVISLNTNKENLNKFFIYLKLKKFKKAQGLTLSDKPLSN